MVALCDAWRGQYLYANRSRLVFGTDEEKALVNAITTISPNSNHMLYNMYRDISTKTKNKNWSMIVLTKLTDKIFRLNLRKQWAYDS